MKSPTTITTLRVGSIAAIAAATAAMMMVTMSDAFSILPQTIVTPLRTRGSSTGSSTCSCNTALFASNVGVFFGTSTGSTETVADMIVEQLGDVAAGPFDVDDGDAIVESFRKFNCLIVGTPTWNTGADTERSGTGWDELYYGSLQKNADCLSGKKVAVFGLGDSVSYAENFSDAAGELHDVFENLGCQMGYGYVSQEGYLHEDSKSIRGDKFCGLLCDMVNQEELTEERVKRWVAQLAQEGFFESSGEEPVATTSTATAAAATAERKKPAPVVARTTAESAEEIIARLEQENAQLRKLVDLEEGSKVLDQSIASHDTGYTPHTNPVTGKTMWTSADGRSCYYTQAASSSTGAAATATKQSTRIAP